MCPFCAATAAVVMGSAVSTGGVTALVVKLLRRKKADKNNDTKEKE